MEYITEDRARLLMVEMFKEYEREVIAPRHAETQGELGEIKAIVNKGKGAMYFAGCLTGIASLLWIVLQIRSAINH